MKAAVRRNRQVGTVHTSVNDQAPGQPISGTGFPAAACGDIQFKKVGLFDVPFVFGLMLDGSLAGAFSDSYLRDAGHFKLFTLVLGTVFVRPLWMTRHPAREQTLLVCSKGLEVGFIQLDNTAGTSECPVSTIALFAIAKEHQNQGLATQALSILIATLPRHAILEAYCTKYARAMQHVLLKLHFTRNKARVDNLARFSYQKV